jgi:hypothetical protein
MFLIAVHSYLLCLLFHFSGNYEPTLPSYYLLHLFPSNSIISIIYSNIYTALFLQATPYHLLLLSSITIMDFSIKTPKLCSRSSVQISTKTDPFLV